MSSVVPPNLVDDEGDLTQACWDALVAIFHKYDVDKDGVLNDHELDNFARDTNGDVFDEDSRAEIRGFLDVDDKGNLKLKGFMEMYNLQTNSEPEATWRDLQKHGYDNQLMLVASRNEDNDDKSASAANKDA
ncbi:hypothetical protein BGW38_001672 [Lunasporangiospora selenospora]|uniref:EF-hand domain-containing protein n=1 Tax=Lunasporangiospora selenospora TaxID=979761 RepID=A0A9P6G2F9_9FUNG|nr:hypothetical protein BGW38_001672 [Lunasporangiospora selenospora]